VAQWSRNFVKMLPNRGGHRLESDPRHKVLIIKPIRQIPGCHMVVTDWATWHPYIQSMHTTCRSMIHPCQPIRICCVSIVDLPMSSATSSSPYSPLGMLHQRRTSMSTCCISPTIRSVSLPRQLLMSPVPHVTLSVVTHVTSGLVQPYTQNVKSA
jgi:hypothetical protein